LKECSGDWQLQKKLSHSQVFFAFHSKFVTKQIYDNKTFLKVGILKNKNKDWVTNMIV